MTDAVEVFVPGHITGLFSVHRHADPERAGSRGAGVTLTDGVTVALTPAPDSLVTLNGDPVEMPPVAGVLDALDVTAEIHAETPLPLGAGFGVSGAMALGTAYAANAAFDCGKTDNAVIRVAHEAEVSSGTGLGDVVAQARGGVPIRLEPGAPPHGRLDAIPAAARVEYLTFGGLATSDVISGSTTELSAAGEDALTALLDRPTLPGFIDAARSFARDAGVITDDVAAVLDDVDTASMAMLGRTVYTLGTGLTDAGYDAETCRVHPAGATFEE
ncbi:pantoate kinase [Halocalculus aciditolerans]|uniref:Pantoate kinase n=1 Tax=Halocalculus aciditolerans TaxID=1383812 RepID=A0A830FNZ3_9EURY|nr:pantoate kinase [Halocalculus aciditolerans]GGL72055.1 sugar kinase [Halocalculus aciditolerans]